MNYYDLTDKTITGKELRSLFADNDFVNLLYSEKVVFGATQSLKRIEQDYGSIPSTDGGNNTEIEKIRDFLYLLTVKREMIKGLTITAPHTHWREHIPVVYKYSKRRNEYLIGPHDIYDEKLYTPVSFVFNLKQPLPYEWADASVIINADEWQECYYLITKVNNDIPSKTIPLGMAIDFRFRQSLTDDPQPSLEEPYPKDKGKFKDFSIIVNKAAQTGSSLTEITEQVSWHAQSNMNYNFDEHESALLEKLKSFIESINDPLERQKIINDLMAGLV